MIEAAEAGAGRRHVGPGATPSASTCWVAVEIGGAGGAAVFAAGTKQAGYAEIGPGGTGGTNGAAVAVAVKGTRLAREETAITT